MTNKLYTEEQVRKAIDLAKAGKTMKLMWSEIKEYDYYTDEILNSLTPIELPSERTLELCNAVLNYLGSKLNGDISPSPSINSVACLAADIKKELRQLAIVKIKLEGCNNSCSPSDWYKGGKCDKNGCYYEDKILNQNNKQ